MDWQFHPLVIPLLVGAAVTFGVFLTAYFRRQAPGARPLALLALASCLYSIAYAGEIGSNTLSAVQTWLKIEYLGIVHIAPLIFVMALDVSDQRRYLRPFLLMLLGVIPSITLLLAWTGELHEWLWQGLYLRRFDELYLANFEPGIWYIINSAYTIILLLLSLLILMQNFARHSDRLYRRQIATILLSMMIPILLYLVYLFNLPGLYIDLNPFGGTIMAVLVAWALFFQRLFDVVPIARENLLAGIRDAVIVTDARGRVVTVNGVTRQTFGITALDVAGQAFESLFAEWHSELAPRREHTAEAREIMLERGGQRLYFDMRIAPLRDVNQRARGHLFVLRDITLRVSAQEALKSSYENLVRLREIDVALAQALEAKAVAAITCEAALELGNASVAIFLERDESTLHIVHGTGLFPTERIGSTIAPGAYALSLPDTPPPHSQKVQNTTPAAQEMVVTGMLQRVVVHLYHAEQQLGLLVLEYAQPYTLPPTLRDLLGLLGARAAVALYNAELYEDRAHLIEELKAFAQTVAHDLKNPLGAMVGYVSLLRDGDLDSETASKFQNRIETVAHKSVSIINSLLLLAGTRESAEIELSPLDTATLVSSVLENLQLQINDRQAQITLPDTWHTARGYAPWVEQIWANLISNAIKYGGTPPQISLGSEKTPDGKVRFWVDDNGAGLSPEEQVEMFRPFTRLSQARVEGHGLGLSIVQRIVERLQGAVGVESTPGAGSRFYFILPPA